MKNKKTFKTTMLLVSTLLLSANMSGAERSCHDIVPGRFSCLDGRFDAIFNTLLYLDKGDELIQSFKTHKAYKSYFSDTHDIYKYRKEHNALPPIINTQPFYKKTYSITPEVYEAFPSIDKPERAQITKPEHLQLMGKQIKSIEHILQIQDTSNDKIDLTTLATRLSIIEETLIQKPLGIFLIDFLESMYHWGPCIQNAIKRLESAKCVDSICYICHGNAVRPILCKNHHSEVMCVSCLRQIQDKGNKCPICKISLNEYYK